MSSDGDSRSDVIIVGGGPSGSCAARELARRGYSVAMFDSRNEIGTPVNCGEALSKNTLNIAGLGEEGPWIVNRMDGYRIISPSGQHLFSSTDGYNIRRNIFDRTLHDRAVEEGAIGFDKCPVSRVEHAEDGWKVGTLKGNFVSDFLVMACGMNGALIRQIVPEYGPSTMASLGAKVPFKDDGKELLFFVKGDLLGGYGWYFPRGDEVNIGVVTPNDPVKDLNWLMERTGIDPSTATNYHGGLIPIDGMHSINNNENAILVGDAGGFTNPISKGGIIGAVLSGKEGGKAVSDHLSGDELSLRSWEIKMSEHPAFDPLNLKRKALLSSLGDDLLDDLTSIANGRDIWTIRSSEILKEAFKRKKLLKSFRGSLQLIKGGREWAKWAF